MVSNSNPAVNPPEHIQSIRELADVVIKIDRIDVPSFKSPQNPDSKINPETDPEWWNSYKQIEDLVHGTGAGMGFDLGSSQSFDPKKPQHDRHLSMKQSAKWIKLDVEVYANGDVGIYAQYYAHSSSWEQLYRGHRYEGRPGPLKIGREVASAELTILAKVTESCAEALDYWQTQLGEKQYSQSQWAAIRDVGRQTVHDRVTEARTKVEE